MQCTTNSAGCPGPFTAESCDSCAAKERDGCLNEPARVARTTPPKTCEGPFKGPPAWRCPDCMQVGCAPGQEGRNAWEAMKKNRDLRRQWLAKHKAVTVKPLYLASECSSITPAQIDYCYGQGSVDWCPWVRIGNLYTTVTTGNDVGWRLLLRDHLQADPHSPRDINVFTGRHGNPEGTLTADDHEIFSDRVADADHLLQDILQKSVADGHYRALAYSKKPRIKLWDVGTTAGSTMTKTQQLASECLRKNEVVIFAWCWSLLSFYKTSEREAAGFSKWDQNQPYNKPIADIVKERYGWATPPGNASAHHASAWRSEVGNGQSKVDRSLAHLFPDHLAEEAVRDKKDSLMEKVRATHYR